MADDAPAFSKEEERLLLGLLDVMVPASPDGRLPGAGSRALVRHVAESVARTPMLRSVLDYGLSTVADRARTRNAGGWDALSAEERTALVSEFAAEDQFFLPAFLFLLYTGYYTDAAVVSRLGLEPRPPHPAGYPMEPDDPSLLDPVRRRGKMYRD